MSNNQDSSCTDCFDKNHIVFSALNAAETEELQKNYICSAYKKGELIYKEGDTPHSLLCLAKGKVKIFKEGISGREQIVRMAKPVEFIGFRALFAEENYISSALAIEDSVICAIKKNVLYDLLAKNGDLGINIIKYLAKELGFSNERTVNLTQKHIRGRLAESLLFLLHTYGTDDEDQTLNVYLSREDIANLSNMTTSNAIRTLSSFANENVIELIGRKIKILNEEELEQISENG